MKNRELFVKDPGKAALLNNGVAHVLDAPPSDPQYGTQLETLRYELETFVCEGEFAKGLDRILSAYLGNLSKSEQPAIWVSGFFGSGKTHLVKVLCSLWTDFKFPDGATARGLVKVPNAVRDGLKELTIAGKRNGGLHAAIGRLGGSSTGGGVSDSIRLALLGIVFRSAGLPTYYPAARLVMWLRDEGLLDNVRGHIQKAGRDFAYELLHLYVSSALAKALLSADSSFAANEAAAKAALDRQFGEQEDISNQDVVTAVRSALSVGGKFPCTLIVLDEVQQFIGDNSDRTYIIQEVTETLSKELGGRLMFVATGQSALTGTPQLQKLRDRFSIGVQLSDIDVETVIRKIVLLKKPDKEAILRDKLATHSGEISRHLKGTKIEAQSEDEQYLVADYPLLPVRRRFWEKALRAVDTSKAGQLRTQLRIVHEAAKDTADAPLGTVVSGDFIYDQVSTDLIQTGELPREIDEIIRKQRDVQPDGDLRSKLCALAFLIGKLPHGEGGDLGIRANAETFADLLVEDLGAGSTELRKQIPAVLDKLAQEGILMPIGDHYDIQTAQGKEWERDYNTRFTKLLNDDAQIANKRADLLRQEIGEMLKEVKLPHGRSKVQRKIESCFGPEKPTPSGQGVPVWVRDGWNDDERSVVADARAGGTDDPTVYVFVPKRSADPLKRAIAGSMAAEETLQVRGIPTTDEGKQARMSMETRRDVAERTRRALVQEVLNGARVLQGGGGEKSGIILSKTVEAAAQDSLLRMYPQFDVADNPDWQKVIDRARKGDATALEAIGYKGDTQNHPVCSTIHAYIGAGKKGREIRKCFSAGPYGWPQDAIDGALLVLVATGHAVAKQDGQPLTPKQLDQTKIGIADFRVETAVISAQQRIKLRALFQSAGVACKSGEEALKAPEFIDAMLSRADAAGGAEPWPEKPKVIFLEDTRRLTGNEQLFALFENAEPLMKQATEWQKTAERIQARTARWEMLQELLPMAAGLPTAAEVQPQVETVIGNRSALATPDPVPNLCSTVCQALRDGIQKERGLYQSVYGEQMKSLTASTVWQQLKPEQAAGILAARGLAGVPEVQVGTEDEVLASLEAISLADWQVRRDALPQRFADALMEAAKLLEPKAQRVHLASGTLKTEQEVKAWLAEAEKDLLAKLKNGPVVIS